MKKYDYLVLNIFSGEWLHLASDNRYKNGTIIKGFQIKELLKINY